MEYIQPSDAEKRAVRAYCVANSAISTESAPFAKQKRELAAKKKQTRDAMYAHLLATGVPCCVVPTAPPVYVRVKSYTNQAALSPELVADALDELDELPDGADALRTTLLEAIKKKRVVAKQYAEVTKSAPKGVAATEADAEIRALCEAFAAASDELTEVEKALKEKLAPLKERVSREEATVSSFMARANIASQRVNVADNGCSQTFFIRRKQAQKRPRITNAVLETIVERSLASVRTDDPQFRHRFRETVETLIDQLPSETTEKLRLDRGALKRDREE
mgnify:CR=1 FL=1|tara:strand:+ start:627 stop:1463 length:837 start_codon:yes stop_codon:yes gene_type:complete